MRRSRIVLSVIPFVAACGATPAPGRWTAADEHAVRTVDSTYVAALASRRHNGGPGHALARCRADAGGPAPAYVA